VGPISIWQAMIVLAIAILIVWTRYKRLPLVEKTDRRDTATNCVRSPRRLRRWVILTALGLFIILAATSWLSI
jgi:multisubunit Na+/H+ antiporter MnhB subunit